MKEESQAATKRRRVDGWATVLQDLRDYLGYLQVHHDTTTYAEIERVQACITTLTKVWDRIEL